MKINLVNPADFGTAYDIGWIGFTRTFDAAGDAIAYGERWEREQIMPSVNHALVVIGPGECVQAHIDNGVQRGQLSDYINDPKTRVYFRQPGRWNPQLGAQIAASGISQIGCKYDRLLITENALADTLSGHIVNALLRGWPHLEMDRLIERFTPHELICSWLAAYALDAQAAYQHFPLFAKPLSSIDPQQLFECAIFEPFINEAIYQRQAVAEVEPEPAISGAIREDMGSARQNMTPAPDGVKADSQPSGTPPIVPQGTHP